MVSALEPPRCERCGRTYPEIASKGHGNICGERLIFAPGDICLAPRADNFMKVASEDREYMFVPKKKWFVLVEDDTHIILRRKPCPQPTTLPEKP